MRLPFLYACDLEIGAFVSAVNFPEFPRDQYSGGCGYQQAEEVVAKRSGRAVLANGFCTLIWRYRTAGRRDNGITILSVTAAFCTLNARLVGVFSLLRVKSEVAVPKLVIGEVGDSHFMAS